jgi:hypothetical protein
MAWHDAQETLEPTFRAGSPSSVSDCDSDAPPALVDYDSDDSEDVPLETKSGEVDEEVAAVASLLHPLSLAFGSDIVGCVHDGRVSVKTSIPVHANREIVDRRFGHRCYWTGEVDGCGGTGFNMELGQECDGCTACLDGSDGDGDCDGDGQDSCVDGCGGTGFNMELGQECDGCAACLDGSDGDGEEQ